MTGFFRLVGQVWESGGIQGVMSVATVVGIVVILFYVGKTAVAYIQHRMAGEDQLRTELLRQLTGQQSRSNIQAEQMSKAFQNMIDNDHRFQAKTVDALHSIKDLCMGLETRMNGEHQSFERRQEALNERVIEIGAYIEAKK